MLAPFPAIRLVCSVLLCRSLFSHLIIITRFSTTLNQPTSWPNPPRSNRGTSRTRVSSIVASREAYRRAMMDVRGVTKSSKCTYVLYLIVVSRTHTLPLISRRSRILLAHPSSGIPIHQSVVMTMLHPPVVPMLPCRGAKLCLAIFIGVCSLAVRRIPRSKFPSSKRRHFIYRIRGLPSNLCLANNNPSCATPLVSAA